MSRLRPAEGYPTFHPLPALRCMDLTVPIRPCQPEKDAAPSDDGVLCQERGAGPPIRTKKRKASPSSDTASHTVAL